MRPTMRDEFEHSLRRHATRIALEFEGPEAQLRHLTYGELDRWSRAVAHQLVLAGVGRGDVVALYTRTGPEFVVVDLAIARIGAVKLPVNAMLPAATVAYILRAGRARVLVAAASMAAAADIAAVGLDLLRMEVIDGPATGAVPLAACPAGEPPPLPDPGVGPADPAALYFTGGTTGWPKGVLHTQGSTVALHHAQLLEAEIAPEDRLLLLTPLAHAAGLFAQSALIRGATCLLVDGFDAAAAVAALVDRAVTWMFLVPTMIYRMLDVLAAVPPGPLTLRTVVYGAAPIAPSRLEQALDLLGPVFVQLYGQTESPNWGTRLAKSDHDPKRPELLASCGQASIAADVKVVDDDGTALPAGDTGEICLRTPYLLREYVGDPEATAAKFLGDWIRTGDIGVLDDRGYLYLRDRKNDMVISGGMNVYCREVEDVLARHPQVGAVAVIGVPHDDWGEAVHAIVVPAGDGFSADELLVWARPQLAAYARPKSVETVADLPETPFGKVDKKALRAPYWADRDRGIG